MKIHHLGNTANNAFHNVLLMNRFTNWKSELPIRMFGLTHAISAPAWEIVQFQTQDAAWVAEPNWAAFPEAQRINSQFSDIFSQNQVSDLESPSAEYAPASSTLPAAEKVKRLVGRSIARSPFHKSFNTFLVKRAIRSSTPLNLDSQDIAIVYGADSLLKTRPPQPLTQAVSLEHGTVRWIADGPATDLEWRKMYQQQVQKTQHLWVTNLDPRTLEIAEDIMPGRWTATPHPFMFDYRVPFLGVTQKRNALLHRTRSEYLVLLASSQNWSKHHDKGSKKALDAFIELRQAGVPVGLVAAHWGLQVEESKALLAEAGLGEHVEWVSPMPRFELQQMMANVDVIWDQFGLDAFGALALRALEQGAPLVSRGLKPEGEALIGSPVPWMEASSCESIVSCTRSLFDEMNRRGRNVVLDEISIHYRTWLETFHSPAITAQLQDELYTQLLSGSSGSRPDAWARLTRELRGA